MSDDQHKDENYVVGPGNPPFRTRWKSGVSGNPKGRPKGSVSIAALLQKEGLKKVPISEGGRKKFLSKIQVVVHQITNGAMKGEPKATALFIHELAKLSDVETAANPNLIVPNLDAAAMRRIAERVLKSAEDKEQHQREKGACRFLPRFDPGFPSRTDPA
jgi:hypothetical protein